MRALPHLSASTRRKLEAICQQADSPDAQTKRRAEQEACRELVKASSLPSGTSRDRALASCSNAAGGKGSTGK
jgi:hypothetical protein